MSAPRRTQREGGRGEATLGPRFLLLALAALAAMLLDHRQDHLTHVREVLSVIVHPVRVAVNSPFAFYRSVSESLSNRSQLLAENAALKRQNLGTRFELQQLEALRAENDRLRELLEATERLETRSLVAEILATDPSQTRQRFNLNRGLVDGVFVGQAILGRNGILGQIVRVEPWSSEALLITDADHAVPVMVSRSSIRTIARGTGDERRLILDYLPNSADVAVGDLLVSSGLGEVYPSGYPVGRVIAVQQRPGQPFADVIAEPVAELNRGQEVLLVFRNDPNELLELPLVPEDGMIGSDVQQAVNGRTFAEAP